MIEEIKNPEPYPERDEQITMRPYESGVLPVKLVPDFDDCIAGLVDQYGLPTIVCYDYDKVIEKIMSRGMSIESAIEYFNNHIVRSGAYAGLGMPCFIRPYDKDAFEAMGG